MTLVVPCLHNMFMVLLIFALGNFDIGATKPILLVSGSPRGEGGGLCVRGQGLLSLYTQQVHEASKSDVRIALFLLGKCPRNKTSEVCEIARFCPQRRPHVHATFMAHGKRPPPPVALAECILVKEVERHWSIFTLTRPRRG